MGPIKNVPKTVVMVGYDVTIFFIYVCCKYRMVIYSLRLQEFKNILA